MPTHKYVSHPQAIKYDATNSITLIGCTGNTQEKTSCHPWYKSTNSSKTCTFYVNFNSLCSEDMEKVTLILSLSTGKPLLYNVQEGYITASIALSRTNHK